MFPTETFVTVWKKVLNKLQFLVQKSVRIKVTLLVKLKKINNSLFFLWNLPSYNKISFLEEKSTFFLILGFYEKKKVILFWKLIFLEQRCSAAALTSLHQLDSWMCRRTRTGPGGWEMWSSRGDKHQSGRVTSNTDDRWTCGRSGGSARPLE